MKILEKYNLLTNNKIPKKLSINQTKKRYKKIKKIKTGKLVYIKYLLLKNDEIKISNFIGLCISIKNKNNTFLLYNIIKKDKIKLCGYLNSPLLIKFKILQKYKKKYRLNKLYFK